MLPLENEGSDGGQAVGGLTGQMGMVVEPEVVVWNAGRRVESILQLICQEKSLLEQRLNIGFLTELACVSRCSE